MELKPDKDGFRYVLMWMNHILADEKDRSASEDYVTEWRDFVKDCEQRITDLEARLEASARRTTPPNAALSRLSPA